MEFLEVRMEVLNESEAIEYCNSAGLSFDHTYMGRGDNSGKLMMLAWRKSPIQHEFNEYETVVPTKKAKRNRVKTPKVDDGKKNYIVGTPYNSGFMMLGKSRVTFNIDEAQRFTNQQAVTKAHFMTLSSREGYHWVARKVH